MIEELILWTMDVHPSYLHKVNWTTIELMMKLPGWNDMETIKGFLNEACTGGEEA